MKKTFLLCALAATAVTAQAQLTLPAPPYVQNFDGLTTGGLPTGWGVYTAATSTSLGTVKSLASLLPGVPFQIVPDTITCAGLVKGGGFKNFPSATVTNPGDNFCPPSPAVMPAYTNRALGLRQVDKLNSSFPDSDPGAAFVLQLANTTGRNGFTLSFKLQSLDTSSPRISTWMVDYGFGATPSSFTPATATGTMTTGNKTFSNNTVNVNFGTALDNQTGPVYIRIVTLTNSSGSGNRASTAIDDFSLNYKFPLAVTNVSAQPALDLNVLGAASSDKVTFRYNVEENAAYNFSIYDMTGRTLHSQSVDAVTGGQELTVSGLQLAPGMYFAKMNNSNSSAVTRVIVQ